jgi:hypothetical protein
MESRACSCLLLKRTESLGRPIPASMELAQISHPVVHQARAVRPLTVLGPGCTLTQNLSPNLASSRLLRSPLLPSRAPRATGRVTAAWSASGALVCLNACQAERCLSSCQADCLTAQLAMVLAGQLLKSRSLKTLDSDARRQRKLGNTELMLVQLNKHFRVRSPGPGNDFMHLQAPATCDDCSTSPTNKPHSYFPSC